MKVKHFILFFTFFSPYLFASSYRIVNVDYEIKGSTRKYALERKVDIDKKKIIGYESRGFFIDIGVPEDYYMARKLYGIKPSGSV